MGCYAYVRSAIVAPPDNCIYNTIATSPNRSAENLYRSCCVPKNKKRGTKERPPGCDKSISTNRCVCLVVVADVAVETLTTTSASPKDRKQPERARDHFPGENGKGVDIRITISTTKTNGIFLTPTSISEVVALREKRLRERIGDGARNPPRQTDRAQPGAVDHRSAPKIHALGCHQETPLCECLGVARTEGIA